MLDIVRLQCRQSLVCAVAALKQNEPKALANSSHGSNGFKDRDSCFFCAGRDGKVDAHIDPAQVGRSLKDLYDIDEVAFGQEMMATAYPAAVEEVSYMWPKLSSSTPAQKVSFVARAGDLVCEAGFCR